MASFNRRAQRNIAIQKIRPRPLPRVYEEDLAPDEQRTSNGGRITSLVKVEVWPNALLGDSEYLYFGNTTFID